MIDAGELSQLIQISVREARFIIHLVQQEMKKEGYYIPKSKKLMAPAERVLKKIGAKNEK